MSQVFLGQIIQGGWNFAPRNFAFCNGQLLPISQYTALFSLLGTNFGGDGRTTFGLPDLRGRAMVHFGQGPGLQNYALGEKGGTETTTLQPNNLPSHNHTLNVSASTKSSLQQAQAGSAIARSVDLDTAVNANPAIYTPAGTATDTALASSSIGNTGNNIAFNNLSPFQAVNCVISLFGIFPSRN